MDKYLFYERQQIRCPAFYMLLGFLLIGIITLLIHEQHLFEGFAWIQISLVSMILLIGTYALWALYQSEMSFKISKMAIKLKLKSPLFSSKRKIKLKDIDSCQLVSTPPLAQWHGGNISFIRHQNFSFFGRTGIFITTKGKESYFIGSKNIDALKHTLEELLQK